MSKPQNPIQMAVIGAAHGIKGEVRVKSFTGDPLALDDYGPLYDEAGRAFTILDIRMQKDMAVVRFKGVADRSAAEALNGTALYVDRDMLPDDLEDEEFYHADLIGLDAVDLEGAPIGKVLAVQNFGGGDILEIARGGKSTVLVPFTRAAVPDVDTQARKVRVDPVAAGLVDTDDDGDEEDRKAVDKRPRGPKSAGGNR
ncbi:ribosome maturation factor RimM [Mesorhizobium australicum]|uniref:Ribosome maturation factor RimM n=1 Tax=Mesorhizobium australicum TaxID=536018 RepID=A0A1X7Q094_9HYPH|nr:ribosome maturation factor RimM [Mesorhizobium australicum]SMH57993.1 16S rRNA processing protein RimM [Mesorhizobium australicum]